jgi:hypothetical protein
MQVVPGVPGRTRRGRLLVGQLRDPPSAKPRCASLAGKRHNLDKPSLGDGMAYGLVATPVEAEMPLPLVVDYEGGVA